MAGIVGYLVYAAAMTSASAPAVTSKVTVFPAPGGKTTEITGRRVDRRLGWAPHADVHFEVRLFWRVGADSEPFEVVTEYAMGSRGQRMDLEELGRPEPATADIVAIGGSQTMGQGMPHRATFVARTGRALGMSVVNLAWEGYGSVQSLMRLRDHLDLRPRIVLYGLWFGHYDRNVYECGDFAVRDCIRRPIVVIDDDGRPAIKPPGEETMSVSPRIRTIIYLRDQGFSPFVYNGMVNAFFNAYEAVSKRVFRESLTGVPWRTKVRAFEFVMREMKKTTDRIDSCLVVVNLANYQGDRVLPLPPEIKKILDEREIPYVDTADALQSAFDAGRRADVSIKYDGHLSEYASELIADEVVRRLREGLCPGKLPGSG